jgi:Flp pilus assembly protein TadD
MHALKGGQAYLASGEYARAARAMERALGHVPNDRTAMASLGNIFNWMNEYDRADSVLRKTIELYPTMPLARMHLAQTLAMTGRFADAREMLESARRLMKPDDPSRGTFARLDSLIATRAPGPGTLAPSSRNPDLGESLPPPR